MLVLLDDGELNTECVGHKLDIESVGHAPNDPCDQSRGLEEMVRWEGALAPISHKHLLRPPPTVIAKQDHSVF